MAYGLWGHRKRSSYYLPLSPATNPQSACRVVLVETSYQAPQAKERAPRSASTREGPRASDFMSREARSCSRWEADRNIADDDSRGCRARRSRLEARAALGSRRGGLGITSLEAGADNVGEEGRVDGTAALGSKEPLCHLCIF